MKKNYVVALAAIVLLVAGVVVASNMGFKLNKPLEGPGTNGSASGTQDVALPFNQQTSLVNASHLHADIIASGGTGVSVSRFNPQTDALLTYAGVTTESDFALTPAEGYRVKLSNTINYIIVGSHDPGLVVNLDGPGTNGSASGSQLYAYPYHSTANSASQLRDEILAQAGGAAILSISRFNPQTDALLTYAGVTTESDFALTPGEAYIVKTSVDIAYVPSHY
jgi:hypothetical protein